MFMDVCSRRPYEEGRLHLVNVPGQVVTAFLVRVKRNMVNL